MRTIFLSIISFTISLAVHAYEKRDLLQKSFNEESLKNTLILNQKWVNYPDYNDRVGWDALTGSLKQEIISRGEIELDYDWKVIKATDYIEYVRSGNRQALGQPFGSNRSALSNLLIAELAEGKGRFLDQIGNGIWFFCEMTSWAASDNLPDPAERKIDLVVGDMGSFLAWTYYFLKDELTEIHPLIPIRLRQTLQDRILNEYMSRDHSWHVFNATPLTKVNNWTSWVNFNSISVFLLLENDPEKLAAAVYRSMVSVDNFINYYHDDGACEEGTYYFTHAVGKLYDYLQILSYAGVPVSSIFKEPVIKRMGEFISEAYIGDGWVVNYSDASPRLGGPIGVIFRYGEAVGSDKMKQFASHLYHQDKKEEYIFSGTDVFRTIENLKSHQSLIATNPATSGNPSMWYPQTEILFIRDQSGFFFSSRGGTNQQSHNHNDVGSFILFYNNKPVFIDIGVGTYTAQTFGSGRYSIFTMQSDFHNLPVINGVSQRSLGGNRSPEEEKYSAKNVRFDARKSFFSADISGSYHPDSKAQSWVRSYDLNPGGKLIIEDQFVLTEAVLPNQVNFITQQKPDISKPGKIMMRIEEQIIALTYDPSKFDIAIEEMKLTDEKLSNSWGESLYRLSFNAKELVTKGKYKFVVAKESFQKYE